MINDLLFVYGSLLSADNEFANYLSQNATFYGDGKFKGRLYDMGKYPGAVLSNDQAYDISGSIVRLKNLEQVLKVLDDYEGFGEDQEQPNLFIRDLLPVITSDEPVNCWVYLYNLSVNGLMEIKSGNYINYLKSH
ncbi:gamma-glutamylcyclotransferase [Mucilaginibacter corticis]|uniref:Gamma-glutamylcyclotransferase n=1 Tax=Mucilaginibacter corticis TaxID=2597670 RepID=A0A556MHR9_9SPHI|nr:gamma-glutamylcyclotransferase family protein [Mucilaginibacter corticis]TSJ39413.1 gamma-glutamylcyclotransferase [Mucilaginibacter corticis]